MNSSAIIKRRAVPPPSNFHHCTVDWRSLYQNLDKRLIPTGPVSSNRELAALRPSRSKRFPMRSQMSGTQPQSISDNGNGTKAHSCGCDDGTQQQSEKRI